MSHQDTIDQAYTCLEKAYAPYSGFKVSAVIKSGDEFFQGVNIENASYGLTLCAEASAISAMLNGRKHMIDSIVVVSSSGEYTYPCGACLQRISEFSNHNTKIVLHKKQKHTI